MLADQFKARMLKQQPIRNTWNASNGYAPNPTKTSVKKIIPFQTVSQAPVAAPPQKQTQKFVFDYPQQPTMRVSTRVAIFDSRTTDYRQQNPTRQTISKAQDQRIPISRQRPSSRPPQPKFGSNNDGLVKTLPVMRPQIVMSGQFRQQKLGNSALHIITVGLVLLFVLWLGQKTLLPL